MEASRHVSAPTVPSRLLRAVSDDRLVTAVRAGDDRAFEVLYDRHHRALLAFCRHMLGSREEAEDALQHVFISAHRNLVGGVREVQLKPWLFTIARNRCLSVLRARRETMALDAAGEPSTDGLAVAGEVERRQELKDLLGDVSRLPDDQRAALVLAEIGDLSHDEISVALDVRPDKVKALIFQARESLGLSRRARDADCREIQEQLATLRGGSLRRGALRRHVSMCASCAAFEAEVRRQRAGLAVVLPVLPTFALKQTVLGAALTGGGAAAAGAGAGAGAVVAAGSSGLAAKAIAIVAIAAGTAGGGVAVLRHAQHTQPPPATRVAPAAVTPAGSVPAAVAPAVGPRARGRSGAAPGRQAGKAHGHAKTPPGHAKTRPTHAKAPPGRLKTTPPGQTKTPTGQAKTPPGRVKPPAGRVKTTPPGQARTPPGQAKTPPGQAQIPSGQAKAKPRGPDSR